MGEQMKRCTLCFRWIWFWQSYGHMYLAKNRTLQWHTKCALKLTSDDADG
jgi:hypothetical protein